MGAGERRGVAILFVALVGVGIGQSMLFAVLPPVARQLGVSPVQIASIFATSATIWVFASPWWGRRSDRVGRRPVMLIGLLGYACSMALMATTIGAGASGLLPAMLVYPALVASRCVFAVFGSGILNLAARLLSENPGGAILATTYEYGCAYLLTAGLMNLLLVLDAWDIATGRKR